MIDLKYQSRRFGVLAPHEQRLWAKSLLIKIHVITGWTVPTGEILTVLIDQFQKKLLEDYPDMNVDEIEFAFRQNGTVVKDWGKAMNLALIDQVLIPYRAERMRLSNEYEERNVPPPPQVILTDDQLDNLHRQDVELFYQRCLKGIVPRVTPPYFKIILVKDGLMNEEDDLEVFFSKRLNSGCKNIYRKD